MHESMPVGVTNLDAIDWGAGVVSSNPDLYIVLIYAVSRRKPPQILFYIVIPANDNTYLAQHVLLNWVRRLAQGDGIAHIVFAVPSFVNAVSFSQCRVSLYAVSLLMLSSI